LGSLLVIAPWVLVILARKMRFLLAPVPAPAIWP